MVRSGCGQAGRVFMHPAPPLLLELHSSVRLVVLAFIAGVKPRSNIWTLRDEPRQPLGAGCRRRLHVFRPPGQAAISAAAPERLEKVPVLEERPAATGTYKARHSASSPGNRGHPGKRNKEKRRVLEKH